MTTEKVLSEVSNNVSSIVDEFEISVSTAAFLTQTVQLDDATTVKFEIWCVFSDSKCFI